LSKKPQLRLRSGQAFAQSAREKWAPGTGSARVKAARWAGPDHDEAMELWNNIPEGSRAGDPPAVNALPKEIMIGDGVVKSVTCKDPDFTIVEESEGKTLTFHRKGFPVGFSDTLWVGRDHFTPCYHVAGLRAQVRYKASTDKAYDGDMLVVGFRDNLTFANKSAETK